MSLSFVLDSSLEMSSTKMNSVLFGVDGHGRPIGEPLNGKMCHCQEDSRVLAFLSGHTRKLLALGSCTFSSKHRYSYSA